MGGGDLNLKKSWHPSTYANIKKVWEREEAARKEQLKVDQLRKEKLAEREAEELRRLQEQAGIISKRADRLDWMYQNTGASSAEASEEYLLGTKRHKLSSAITVDGPKSESLVTNESMDSKVKNKMEAYLREDPLVSIKKAEREVELDLWKKRNLYKVEKQSTKEDSRPVNKRKANKNENS